MTIRLIVSLTLASLLFTLSACVTTPEVAEKVSDQPVGDTLEPIFRGALAKMKSEKFADAVTGFKSIIASDPSLTSPRFNLALALHQENRDEAAMAAVNELLGVEPLHLPGQNLKATLLLMDGQVEASKAVLERMLSVSDFPAAHYNLGVLCDVYLSDLSCARYHLSTYQRLRQDDDHRVTAWLAELENRDKE